MPTADGSVAATPAATAGLLPLGRCGGRRRGGATVGSARLVAREQHTRRVARDAAGSAQTPAPRAGGGLLDDGTPVVRQLRQLRLLPNARAVLLAGAALTTNTCLRLQTTCEITPPPPRWRRRQRAHRRRRLRSALGVLGHRARSRVECDRRPRRPRPRRRHRQRLRPAELTADNLVTTPAPPPSSAPPPRCPAVVARPLLNQAGAAAAETAREHGGARGQQLVIDLRGNDDATDAAAAAARAAQGTPARCCCRERRRGLRLAPAWCERD